MELIKGKWSVNDDELLRLNELPKKELMEIIKGLKLGSGLHSKKIAEKNVYNTIKAEAKPIKVYRKKTAKRSKSDNSE